MEVFTKPGEQIILKAIQAPHNTIKENMGVTELVVADNILDPVKVTRIGLVNAMSIASTLLTTECVITDD